MINRVLKYSIGMGVQVVEMPEGAQILAAQVQHNRIRLWAFVDYMKPPEGRLIGVFATGVPVPHNVKYISTIQFDGGALIYHVFECLPDMPEAAA